MVLQQSKFYLYLTFLLSDFIEAVIMRSLDIVFAILVTFVDTLAVDSRAT